MGILPGRVGAAILENRRITASHARMKKSLGLVALLGLLAAEAVARPFLVVAYNVEHLFDVDGQANIDDYKPDKYTRRHALTKLQNAATLIARFENGRGPDVLILSELEADLTPSPMPPNYEALLARYAGIKLEDMLGSKFTPEIADLPAEVLLAKALVDRGITDYRLVVAENTNTANGGRRLEHKNAVFTRFPVKAARSHPTRDARAILEVLVEVDGTPLYVFSNHWKSGASDPGTEESRVANARTLRARVDEILREDPNADIILGGDFNSQYNHKQRYPQMKVTGLNDVLGSQGNELAVRGKQRDLYNLWYELPPAERGSDTFRGEWGTLMHLIVSRGLYDYRGVQYVDNSFAVAKFPGLNVDLTGMPVRWSGNGQTGSGFSDHFPISARFTTVKDGRADRWIALQKASVEDATAPNARIDFSKLDFAGIAAATQAIPAGTSLRADKYVGQMLRVEGQIAPGSRHAVVFRGETFDLWSFDEPLRNRLRQEYPEGATIRFFGKLGQYRGRWQFVIEDASWVK
jgi:hypothetical protein